MDNTKSEREKGYQSFLKMHAEQKENYTALHPLIQNTKTESKLPTPQLNIVLSDLQYLVEEYSLFTIDLQNRLQTIYTIPEPEVNEKQQKGISKIEPKGDIISEIKMQILLLKISKERLNACLLHLANII